MLVSFQRQTTLTLTPFFPFSPYRTNTRLPKLLWVRSSWYAALAAELPRRLPHLGLLQRFDDLRLSESASSPGRLLTG